MKAVLFHGKDASPQHFWFPYARRELERRGFEMRVPELPDSHDPAIWTWLPFALQSLTYDENTMLIGHSTGSALILALLERLERPVQRTILVSAFFETRHEGAQYKMLKHAYDWDAIKQNGGEIIVVSSDNDPWGYGESAGRDIADRTGGRFVLIEGQGHFGSVRFAQPYREFPELLDLIDGMAVRR